jgi:hypothetical protein
MTKARTIADLGTGFVNISDTGTEGTKVATGTTAQRGSTAGQIRFNSTTNLAEYYNGTEFKSIDTPPTVSSVSVTDIDSNSGTSTSFTITGTNFQSGATVKFIGNDGSVITADTTTVNSSTSITATEADSSFSNSNEPYDVKVENSNGLAGTLADQINVDTAPTWSTASGNIGNVYEAKSANITVSATDAEGDTIAYSETGGTVLSTNGLSINSSSGIITGTAPSVSGDTTINFTLRATANSKTTDRAFNIIIKEELGTSTNPATSSAQLYNAGYTTDGNYYYNNTWTGGSARQCYTRFNTRDGVHWHRWSPEHLSGYHASEHGGGANNTTINISNPVLNTSTLDNSNKDYEYDSYSSGSGVSWIVRTGLQWSDIEDYYFGIEMHLVGVGDSGNRGFVGLDFQNPAGTGNWGHDYSEDIRVLEAGRDASITTNVRNFAAVKFEEDSGNTSNTSINHHNSAVGGMFGTTTNSSDTLWNRYSDTNNAGYLPANSGHHTYSRSEASNNYWAIRIGGWSDTGTNLTHRGIFWIGNK